MARSAAAGFSVRRADWNADREHLRQVREEVFVREQGVPLDLEWDEMDEVCSHVLAEADGRPIGTGRLLPDGHIGRLAVLAPWRGRGVGKALLEELLAEALRRGMPGVVLHAQTHARAFYERQGFRAQGDGFMEAGIPHVQMFKPLTPSR